MLLLEVVVCFVDIGGIVRHHLIFFFLFILNSKENIDINKDTDFTLNIKAL